MRIKWAHIYRFYELMEPYLKLSVPLENRPKGEKILVLSPHIDDETIGCGGSLAKHAAAGNPITVLFIADCSKERQREGEEAGQVLGISKRIYWEYQSKTLDRFPEITRRLQDVFTECNPDLVYIPSLIDRHNDHVSLNYFFYQALRDLRKDFLIYSYEIWTTLIPNIIVDISDQVETKKKAMLCYASQLQNHNWLEGTLSLNRYRGMIAGAGSHGEGFFRATPQNYMKIWNLLYG